MWETIKGILAVGTILALLIGFAVVQAMHDEMDKSLTQVDHGSR